MTTKLFFFALIIADSNDMKQVGQCCIEIVCPFTCSLYAQDSSEAVRLCEALLEEPNLDPAVRIGDVFGFLVDHYCQRGNFNMVTRLPFIWLKSHFFVNPMSK